MHQNAFGLFTEIFINMYMCSFFYDLVREQRSVIEKTKIRKEEKKIKKLFLNKKKTSEYELIKMKHDQKSLFWLSLHVYCFQYLSNP